jgi:hypothetical protein
MWPFALEITAGDFAFAAGISVSSRHQPVIRHAAAFAMAVDWAYDAQPEGLLAKSCRRSI